MSWISNAIGRVNQGAANIITPRRVLGVAALGGLAGAVYSRATTEKMSPTGKARDALFAGLVGTAAGFVGAGVVGGLLTKASLTRGTIKHGVKQMATSSWKNLKQAGRFARHHPLVAAAGLGIAGLAAWGGYKAITAPSSDPADYASQTTTSSTGFDPTFGGEFSQPEHQRFIASTNNLVQGMHRNRHG